MTISACITAFNEEFNLEKTLQSLDWVDEIIVVDCESSDLTSEIAQKFNCKIFSQPNNSNLNVNKNFGFSKASANWILCLDADEVIPQKLKLEIQDLLKKDIAENGFFLKRKNNYFGKFLMRGGNYPDKQLRLFRNGFGKFPAKHVHERMKVRGEVGILNEPFEHYPYRDVKRYIEKLNFYTTFECEYRYNGGQRFSANKFFKILVSAFIRFLRRYFFKLGFLDGFQGFAAVFFDFVSQVLIQIKLWEICRNNRNG